ncbi:MAG: tetratricopeptide repeat protein, partial [Bacteroidia bacterium]|nr:tetratricopeptide repeat protein [Bacteroidia bacterium]
DQLLAAMAELNRPCLLVIDNANEVEDLKENYLRLHRCKNFHLLLTTRITTFEQAETYRIEGLPPAQALELFQKYYPKHTPSEDALFEQIRTATGGNTLVIELLSKNLALLNKLKTRYTLTDLLSDLQNKGVLALSQSRAVSTGYQSKEVLREESPEALIAAMYELGDLSREEVAALSVLSVLPPEEIPFDRLEVLCPQSPNLDETLLSLSQKGWIEYNETATTFKISPVVQQITRKKNENLYEDCEGMIRVLLEKLEYEGGIKHLVNSTYEEAAIWVRYAGAVVEGFEAPYRSTSVLCERMGAYFTATGDLIQALAWFEKYEEICTRLCERDPDNADFKNLLAISYSKLGSTYTALGQLDRALAFYEQFTSLIQELYEAYPNHVSFKNGLAISYAKLGETHTALGQLDRALAFYEQYHRLEKELHEAYPNHVSFKNGLAISYQFLGITHTALGQHDRALVFYEQYHRLEKELHETHPDNVNFKKLLAISYQFLGNTHTALGQLDRALAFFEDETQLFEQLYEAYPNHVSFKNGLAISYEKLGSTHTALGQLDRALAFYEERARLGKELYEAYPNHVSFKNGLAISYIKLGDVARRQGDKTAAIDYFRQAEGLYLELVRDAPGYADFQNNLTWVRKTLKELE